MSNYCNDISKSVLKKGGCAVCGQLRLKNEVVPLEKVKNYFALLEEPNVAKQEKKTLMEGVIDISGSVFDRFLDTVCQACTVDLENGRQSKMTLANHL